MAKFFKNIQEKYFSESQTCLWFLFFLIILLTLAPFFKIGFTTSDDFGYYMVALDKGIFADAAWWAKNTGRFYFLITKPVYTIPYLVDNFYYTKFIQYGTLLLSFVLFAIVVNKIFKLKEFTLLVFLLLFAFLTVTPNYHIPVIAYPFFFTFSFSIFLLSLLSFLRYTETKRYKYLILSSFLYAIALLFYENYLVFLLFMLAWYAIENMIKKGWRILVKKSFYKEILPFLVVAAAYILIYFIYRKSVETEAGLYAGSSFVEDFKIKNFFTVLWNYNKAAFPTYIYHQFRSIVEMYSLLPGGHEHNFWYMLKHSQITTIINALLQCYLFVFLLKKITPSISWKKVGFAGLIASLFAFSAHILLAVSEKYQAIDYWRSVSGYVTTYYSYFCIILVISLIVYACIKVCYNNKYLKNSIIGLFTLLVFYAAIIIGYSNDHLSRAWQQSQNKFTMMNKVLQKGILNAVPENAAIYAGEMNPFLCDFGLGICGYSSSWKDYVFLKTGKELNIHSQLQDFKHNLLQDSLQPIYYINLYDTPKSQDILLVLSKINNNSIKWNEEETMLNEATTNEATVYYYSSYKEFMFEFYIPECKQNSTVFMNNTECKIHQGLNVIRIENKNKKEEITSFTLKSNDPFLAKSFLISTVGYLDTEYFQIN